MRALFVASLSVLSTPMCWHSPTPLWTRLNGFGTPSGIAHPARAAPVHSDCGFNLPTDQPQKPGGSTDWQRGRVELVLRYRDPRRHRVADCAALASGRWSST
jgi:hypothetical protein